jgi:hypothetical protein
MRDDDVDVGDDGVDLDDGVGPGERERRETAQWRCGMGEDDTAKVIDQRS